MKLTEFNERPVRDRHTGKQIATRQAILRQVIPDFEVQTMTLFGYFNL